MGKGNERALAAVMAKQFGASILGFINLVLVIWAVMQYRRRQSVTESFYKLWPASILVSVFQVGLGLWFVLAQGKVAEKQHLLYGILVGVGAIAQVFLLPNLPLGRRYRGKPLVYAFWALFVLLLTARSWMSA